MKILKVEPSMVRILDLEDNNPDFSYISQVELGAITEDPMLVDSPFPDSNLVVYIRKRQSQHDLGVNISITDLLAEDCLTVRGSALIAKLIKYNGKYTVTGFSDHEIDVLVNMLIGEKNGRA